MTPFSAKVERDDHLHLMTSAGEGREAPMDRLAALAAGVLNVKFAFVAAVADGRHAVLGLSGGLHPDALFLSSAEKGVLVIPDALNDPRFRHDPMVTGPAGLRFLACAGIVVDGSLAGYLGLCDTAPRNPSPADIERLKALSEIGGPLFASRIAARRCAESTELLRTTLESMEEGIAVFSADGRLAAGSDVYFDLLELPPGLRRIGTPIETIILDLARRGYMGEGEPEAIGQTVIRALRSGRNRRNEIQTPDGRTLAMSRSTRSDGRIIITCIDVTARREIERMKDEFVSTVSHELRTPLTSITGSLGLLMGGAAGEMPDRAIRLVQIAQSNAGRLTKLVNDLLDIDRIEVGRVEFKHDRIDLNELARQVIDDNRPYGVRFGVRIELRESPAPVYVLGDADRLHQVATNLLSNAIKFSPPGEAVTLEVTRGRTNARLSVIDRGAGIPEQFHASIFRRFSQVDNAKRRVKEGTGLGLAISRAIIERHGGSIGFKSAEGQGANFFFELPAVTDAALASANAAFRVLICEDDLTFGKEIRSLLQEDGATVDLTSSIGEALGCLSTGSYQALVVDLLLPDGHGIDLIREVRSRPGLADLPVLVVSAAARETRDIIGAGALNVLDWIDKSALDAPRLVASLAKAAAHSAGGRLKVLHVEDEADLREIVAAVLAHFADVDPAPDLVTARSKLASGRYDVVILDVSLPDGLGTELITDIASGAQAPVPVVIFSASEPSHEVLARVRGALIKSRTSIERLADLVRWAAAAHPASRAGGADV